MTIALDTLKKDITRSVEIALAEDIGNGDMTVQLIPKSQVNIAEVITREDCVVCGTAWFDEVFIQLGGIHSIKWHVRDGDRVCANKCLVTLEGNTRNLLTGERTALNFLQLLSGTATLSRRFADKVANTKIKILDTRKTIPGLRTAQKYAVAIGGCHNHRMGLFDAFLIKENHIAACGGITQAVKKAREIAPGLRVEVEVENREELLEAINARADIVMLDNFDRDQLNAAFELENHTSVLEISGLVTEENINLDFASKAHRVSSGALTKNCRAVDLSFRLKPLE